MQGGWSSSNSCVTGTNSVVVTDRGWNNPKSIGYLENLETDMDDITIEFTSPSEFEILAGTYYVYYSGNTSPVYVESVGVGTMNAAADEVNFTYKVTDQINNFIRTCTVTMTR
jgi:3'-phosphoadenosine 5'-phosphosulfate sulfotransferase (PAPS reductase)/FAD synthetase